MALTGMQQRKLLSQLRKLQTDEPGAGNHNKGVQFMPITVVVFGNSIRFFAGPGLPGITSFSVVLNP